MKQTRTLQDFAIEVERQQNSKRDFIAPAKMLSVTGDGKLCLPASGIAMPYEMRTTFEDQLAREIKYPSAFYTQNAVSFPEQHAALVNAMLQADPRIRMIRTLDNSARAYLSNSYCRIDNWQIAEVALETIQRKGDWQVVGSELTDNRMYLKVMTPWEADIAESKPVRAGFILTNSEVGDMSFSARFLFEMQWCKNGAIKEVAAKMRHASKALLPGFTNGAYEMSNNTKALSDAFLMAQVRDMVNQTVNQNVFNDFVNEFRQATRDDIPRESDLNKVIDVTAKEYGIRDSEKPSILRHIAENGNMNRFGIIDAVTRVAQDVDKYDRSIELEEIGGQLISMPEKQWSKIITISAN